MKKNTLFFFLIAFAVLSVNAQDRGPVAISPASDSGIARVGVSCPTFSWTGMDWAVGYKVVIFETSGPNVLAYKEMEAIASPILIKEIQGQALSWTPSSDERLSNGGVYVWYVQAADTYGTVLWSEGKVFKVEVEARLVGMEETVRESLKEHGVSEGVIDDVLEDMNSEEREVAVMGVDATGSEGKTQDKVGIQGLEGATNTFYGLDAGFSIATGGDYNSFFGRSAGYSTTTGYSNTFLGYNAGLYNTTGNWNTFLGNQAGYYNTTGVGNTFLGDHAGFSNTTGHNNTFIGTNAGGTNTTGQENVFLGFNAGYANTASGNTFLGYYAGRYNTTGPSNTFLGWSAGYSNITGEVNTFIGYRAGYSNTDGGANIFIGYHAGRYNTTGIHNTFLGNNAGLFNDTGNYNTFLGNYAGYLNDTGDYNTFLGYFAGRYNTTGYNNTFLGYMSGYSNETGINNVFLGFNAGFYETGSNKLYIDNSDTSSPLIWGDFYNDILAINGKLCIGTTSSPYAMELETTGNNAAFVAQRIDGATNYINATAGFGNFGTVTNHPLRLAVNSLWRMRLDSDNSLTMANGAMCTAGGTWQNYSKREAKENIHDLTTDEAMDTLKGLVAVKYNYKVDKEEKHVGFIAEDVPELVASKDRNGISAMDIVAVLTKVAQEQQRMVEEQQKTIDKLQKQIDELKNGEK